MTFANPAWLWALALLLPAVLLRIWSSMEGRDAVTVFVSPRLRDDLLFGTRGSSKIARWIRFVLLCAAFALVVISLARPQWGEITQEEIGEGRSVMLAIDTSRSMLATDLKPDRLTRAKFAAHDLIEALPGDQIGLMAFSGTAFVQVPLTTDREALADTIDQLDTYSISRGGTNLAAAIKLSSSSFEDVGTKQHALILFTDGEELEGAALEEAEKAAKNGTMIIAVGVGSTDGAPIPDLEARRSGGLVTDDDGEIVRTKIDTATLEKIARSTDGLFMHLDSNSMNSELVRNALSKLDSSETDSGTRTVPIERYMWPLGLALLLLGIDAASRLWRRLPAPSSLASATACMGILIVSPEQANAASATAAYQLYQDENFEKAAESYESAINESSDGERRARLQLGLGAAKLKQGDHRSALDAFGNALLSNDLAVQEDAHYNLGNTLYRAGDARLQPKATEPEASTAPAPPQPPNPEAIKATLRDWSGAIDHYEACLSLDKNNAQASDNLEFVKSRIEELEQQQEEQQKQEPQEGEDEQEKQENEDQENEKQDGEQEQPQPGENGEPQDQPGESGEDPAEQQPQPEPGEGEDQADQQNAEAGEEGEEDGAQEAQAAEETDADQQVNEETGYTVEQAMRQLEAFADEQETIQKKRRRARARYFKDW